MPDLLIWLVPVAVAAAGLWRPQGGLLVLAATLPLFGAPPGGPYLAALDVAALAAAATAWRAGPAPRSPVDRAVLAFVVVSLVSLMPVIYRPPSWQPAALLGLLQTFPDVQAWSALYSWRAAANLLLGWALYHAVRRAFAGRSLRALGLALAVGVGPAVLLGLASRAGGVDLWAWRPIGGALFDTRLHSLFFHSGWMAEYLVLAAPVAVAAMAAGSRRGRLAAAALAALAAVALLLSLQRAAWLTAAVQLALVLALAGRSALRDRRLIRRLAIGGGLVVALWLAVLVSRPELLEPVAARGRGMTRLAGRLPVWQASVVLVGERPLLGWGLGAFVPTYEDLERRRSVSAFPWLTAHSQYLMVAVERGLLGLVAFGWLVWVLLARLWRSRRTEDRALRLQAAGLAVGLAGCVVYGLAQYVFFLKVLEWLFWILAGAVAALPRPAEPPRRARFATGLALAALLLLPWRLTATEALAAAGDRSYGFHPQVERDGHRHAWTEDRAARRLAWEGERLVIELANGHPRPMAWPVEVTVRIDGRPVVRDTLRGGGFREYPVELGAPRAASLLLEIEARPTFRPHRDLLAFPEVPRSRDFRLLGVAVGPLRWCGGEASDPC